MSSSSSASSASSSSGQQQRSVEKSKPLSEYPETEWEGMVAFVPHDDSNGAEQEEERGHGKHYSYTTGRVGKVNTEAEGKVSFITDSGESIYRQPSEIYVWEDYSDDNQGRTNASDRKPSGRKRRRSNRAGENAHSDDDSEGGDEAGYNGDDSDGPETDKGDQNLTGWPVRICGGEGQGCRGFVERIVREGEYEVSIINERAPTDSSFVIKHRDQLELISSQAALSDMLSNAEEGTSSVQTTHSTASSRRTNRGESEATYSEITQALKSAVQLSGITKIDPLSVGHQLKLLDLNESRQSESRVPSVGEANEQWAEVSGREKRIIIRHLNNCLPSSLRPISLPPESKTSSTPKKTKKAAKERKSSRSSKSSKTGHEHSRGDTSSHTKSSQAQSSEEETEEELDPEDMTIDDLGLEMDTSETDDEEVDNQSTFISAVLDVGAGATLQSTHRILDLLTLCTDWSTMLETSPTESADQEDTSSISTRRTRRATERLRSTSTHTEETAYDSESSNKKTRVNKNNKEDEHRSTAKSTENLTIRQPDGTMRRSARGGSTPGALSESLLARQKYSPKEDQDSQSTVQREGEKTSIKTVPRSQSESDVSARKDRDLKGKSSSKSSQVLQQPASRGRVKAYKDTTKNTSSKTETETNPIVENEKQPTRLSSSMASVGEISADATTEDSVGSSLPSHSYASNSYVAYDTNVGLSSGIAFQHSSASATADATSSIRRRLREERKTHWSHNEDFNSEVIEFAQRLGGSGLPLSVLPFSHGYRPSDSRDAASERIGDSRYLLLHPELVARSMQGLSSVSGGGTSIRRVAEQYGCQGGDSLYDLASQLGIAGQLNLQSLSVIEAEHRKGRMATGISSTVVEEREAGVEESHAEGEDEDMDACKVSDEITDQQDGRRKPRTSGGGKRTQERFAFYNVYCEWAKSKGIVPLAFRNWYYALDIKDRLRYQLNRVRERQEWDRRAYIHEFTSNLDLAFQDRYSEALFDRALAKVGARVHQQFSDILNLEEMLNPEALERVTPAITGEAKLKRQFIQEKMPILYYQLGQNHLKLLEEQCLFGQQGAQDPVEEEEENLPDLEEIPWYMFQRYLFRRNLLCSTVAPTSSFRKGELTKNGREASEAAISGPYLGTETDSDSDDDTAQQNSASIGLNSLRHHDVSRKWRKTKTPEPSTMDELFSGHAVDIDYSYTCHACGREKEALAEKCWNPNCYLCPIYEFKAESRRRYSSSESRGDTVVRDPSELCSPKLASWVKSALGNGSSHNVTSPCLYYNLVRGFSKNFPHMLDDRRIRRGARRGKRLRDGESSSAETDSCIPSVAPKWQKGAIRRHFMPLSEEIEVDTKLRELYGEEYAFAYAHSFGIPLRKSTLSDNSRIEGMIMPYAKDFSNRRRNANSLSKTREYLKCTRNAIGQPVSKACEEQAGAMSNAIVNRCKRFNNQQGVAIAETSVAGGLGDNTSATALARQKGGKTLLRDSKSSTREVFSELWDENERLSEIGAVDSEHARGSYRDTCRFGPVKTADDICIGGYTCAPNPMLQIEAELAQYFHSTAEALSRIISSDSMKEFFDSRANMMKLFTEDNIDQDAHQVVWDRLFNKGALNQNPTPVLANLNLETPAPQNPRNCSVGDRTALGEMITSALQVQFSDGYPTSTTGILLCFDCKIYAGVFNALKEDYFANLETECINHIKEASQTVEMPNSEYISAAIVHRFSSSIRERLLLNASQSTKNAMYSDIGDIMDETNRSQPELNVPKQLQKWGEEVAKHVNQQLDSERVESVSYAIHCLTQGLGALFLLISYLTQMISKTNAQKAFIGSTASRKNTVQISELINEISTDAKATILSRIINGIKGSRYLQSRTLQVLKESLREDAIVLSPLLFNHSSIDDANQSANKRFSAAVAQAQERADIMLPQRSEQSGIKQDSHSTIFEEQPDDEDWSFYTFSAPVRAVGLKRGREDLYWHNDDASSPNSLDLAMLYDNAYKRSNVSVDTKRARLLQPHGGLPNFPTKGIMPSTVTAPFSTCNADSVMSHRYRYDALAPDETDTELSSSWKYLMNFRQSSVEADELRKLRPTVARLRQTNSLRVLSEVATQESNHA